LHYDPDLEKVVKWTEALNDDIGRWLSGIPPFPHAAEAIKKISKHADLMIVSQTPLEALEREWEESGMRKYLRTIAGQEHGTKTEQIFLAASGKYDNDRILMIGDAKGDLDAAKNNSILFFPVIPGHEDKSWAIFRDEGFNRFTSGKYRGKYEDALVEEFLRSLPSEIKI
jgi:HAD superfamily hydrolase (TIGR01549 family)